MALFKQLRGKRENLNLQPLHDGYAYFCIDDGSFHIDYADENGDLHRKQINAKDAEELMGMSLDEIKKYIKNDNIVYIQNGLTPFTSGLTIDNGSVITIKINKEKITSATYDYWTTQEGVYFIFNHGAGGGSAGYGWNTDASPWPDEGEQFSVNGDEYFNVPEDLDILAEEYTYIYTGETCTLLQEDTDCECVKFYVGKKEEKAVYVEDGKTQFVTADMIGATTVDYVDNKVSEYVDGKIENVTDRIDSVVEYVDNSFEEKVPKNITVSVDKADFAVGLTIKRGDIIAFKLIDDVDGFTGYVAEVTEENSDYEHTLFYANNGAGMSFGYGWNDYDTNGAPWSPIQGADAHKMVLNKEYCFAYEGPNCQIISVESSNPGCLIYRPQRLEYTDSTNIRHILLPSAIGAADAQEVEDKFTVTNQLIKGRQHAIAFSNYQAMYEGLLSVTGDTYKVGQSIFIEELNVPDLWISAASGGDYLPGEADWQNGENFVERLEKEGGVWVNSCYRVSPLETLKQDLTNYSYVDNLNRLVYNNGTEIKQVSASMIKTSEDKTVEQKFNELDAQNRVIVKDSSNVEIGTDVNNGDVLSFKVNSDVNQNNINPLVLYTNTNEYFTIGKDGFGRGKVMPTDYKPIEYEKATYQDNPNWTITYDDTSQSYKVTSVEEANTSTRGELRLNNYTANVSSVKGHIYMTSVGVEKYYPEVAFVDRTNSAVFAVQFCSWEGGVLQIKVIGNGNFVAINTPDLLVVNNVFDANFNITVYDNKLHIYINDVLKHTSDLSERYPLNFTNIEQVCLGLRKGTDNIPEWYFSDIEIGNIIPKSVYESYIQGQYILPQVGKEYYIQYNGDPCRITSKAGDNTVYNISKASWLDYTNSNNDNPLAITPSMIGAASLEELSTKADLYQGLPEKINNNAVAIVQAVDRVSVKNEQGGYVDVRQVKDIPIDVFSDPWTIARRGSTGTLNAADPVSDYDLVNKRTFRKVHTYEKQSDIATVGIIANTQRIKDWELTYCITGGICFVNYAFTAISDLKAAFVPEKGGENEVEIMRGLPPAAQTISFSCVASMAEKQNTTWAGDTLMPLIHMRVTAGGRILNGWGRMLPKGAYVKGSFCYPIAENYIV